MNAKYVKILFSTIGLAIALSTIPTNAEAAEGYFVQPKDQYDMRIKMATRCLDLAMNHGHPDLIKAACSNLRKIAFDFGRVFSGPSAEAQILFLNTMAETVEKRLNGESLENQEGSFEKALMGIAPSEAARTKSLELCTALSRGDNVAAARIKAEIFALPEMAGAACYS